MLLQRTLDRYKYQMYLGGIYYIISRSLGPEFGASVGIIFAFANAVAASMNTIGFCDSLNDLLKPTGIIDNGVTDVRIVGTVALVLMCIICAVGMDWESKAQVSFTHHFTAFHNVIGRYACAFVIENIICCICNAWILFLWIISLPAKSTKILTLFLNK